MAIMVLFTGYGGGATLAGVIVGMFDDWRASTIAVGLVCLLVAGAAAIWLREPERASVAEDSGPTANPLAVLTPRYLLGTLMLWLLFISMLTISYCLNSWLPIMLVEVGRDASLAAISVSIFSLGGIIAALGVGLLIDRLGAIRVLSVFLLLSAAALLVTGQVLATAQTSVLLVLLGLCGFFVLGAYGGVNVVLAGFYPHAVRALGIGWAKSVGRIGTVVAPVLIGFGLSNGISETTVMSLFAVPALVATFALIVVGAAGRRGG
jgi:cyanate permease